MTKSLIIKSLERRTEDGKTEELTFTEGVNTIVGRKDAGKTVWLKMLDYLLGDPGNPENAFGKLAEKYVSVAAEVIVNGDSFKIERRWKEPNVKSKVFVSEDTYTTKEFSNYLLGQLGIPVLNYPQGSPFSERAWPELSWRSLFRHIYRQERFWSDIADQQPESEQFAALMQFLGVAEKLFPQKLGEVVSKRKELFTLNAKKEQFQTLIDSIVSQMTSNGNAVQFATAQLLDEKILQLESRIKQSLEERQTIIQGAMISSQTPQTPNFMDDVQLSSERSALTSELNNVQEREGQLAKRLSELRLLLGSVTDEVERLKRAKLAGSFLDDLRITHCPACDQEINSGRGSDHLCFLCLQQTSLSEGSERLEFEIYQLESEKTELTELISRLDEEKMALIAEESKTKERIVLIDRRLQPIRATLGALVDPQISILDAERGRIEEQIENYKRLLSLLDYRDRLTSEIDELNTQIAKLDSSLEELSASLNLEKGSDDLEDGMMTYLDKLNQGNPDRWTKGRVSVRLRERNFSFEIHGTKWKGEVGATTACYFLLSYHYALLGLTSKLQYNYPGLCIIDFPPSLPDGTSIANMENFLVEPFISLCSIHKDIPMQLIVAGRAFEDLQGANRIELDTFWK